jgi:hypothetical protein
VRRWWRLPFGDPRSHEAASKLNMRSRFLQAFWLVAKLNPKKKDIFCQSGKEKMQWVFGVTVVFWLVHNFNLVLDLPLP